VVAPVLHVIVPAPLAYNLENPQKSESITVGGAGIPLGAEVLDVAGLVHKFTVRVTVYVFASVTVIEVVVAPVLHNKVPELVVANTEFVQLSVTVTNGAGGIGFGVAVGVAGTLTHPFADV